MNKRVIIGETGWPSAGATYLQAVPSLANQLRYLQEFLSQADREGVDYFYFDGFDELWKTQEPGLVGQNWGYAFTDRSAKHYFYGVLLPTEDLLPYHIYLPLLSKSGAATSSTDSASTALPGANVLQALSPAQSIPPVVQGQNPQPFVVYDEWPEATGDFVPSGWMGDIDRISIYECDRSDPYDGDMAIRASFSATGGSQGWAGAYWQYPENNWGNLPQGINLTGMNELTFWARGEQGGEKVQFLVGGIGDGSAPYPDSIQPAVKTSYISLTTTWQQYTIDLSGKDLSHVIGGFGWVTNLTNCPHGATFYLDDIQFDYNPN